MSLGRRQPLGEELEVELVGQPVGVLDPLGEGEPPGVLFRVTEPVTVVLGPEGRGRGHTHPEPAADQGVVKPVLLGSGVADPRRGDDRQAAALGEAPDDPGPAAIPTVVVVAELDEEPLWECPFELLDHLFE